VIGGGAAGLSGALTLARARRSVLVLDAGEPRNAPAAGVHGFLSRDGIAPTDLVRLGAAEVTRYGGTILDARATSARPAAAAITGSSGTSVTARSRRSGVAVRIRSSSARPGDLTPGTALDAGCGEGADTQESDLFTRAEELAGSLDAHEWDILVADATSRSASCWSASCWWSPAWRFAGSGGPRSRPRSRHSWIAARRRARWLATLIRLPHTSGAQ
jgi:choline dehydrogenase-like flavoprotein